MNNIEALIAQFCPNRVEFQELGEVFKISRGRVMSKEYLRDNAGIFPVYSSQTANNGEIGEITTYDYDGEYLTWTTDGANAGTIFYRNGKFSITNVCGLLKAKGKGIIPRFAFYFLGIVMKNYVSSGMGNPKLMSNVVEKIKIPIPPLPIQQEIVNILDKFTQLQAELHTELQARRAQYEYYRNELLDFEGKEVEWKTLGEVSKILRGTAITEKETISGEFPVVANSPNPIYFHGKSNRSGETIVIARSGAYSGLVSYWNKPFFLTDAFSIHPDNTLFKTKFVYFLLKREQEKIHLMKKGSGVPHVRAKDFESYSIPMPPLSEQERIVSILDKFDALVNDISVGLPAEIQARRKQYEYYRGKLLDFKPVKND